MVLVVHLKSIQHLIIDTVITALSQTLLLTPFTAHFSAEAKSSSVRLNNTGKIYGITVGHN